MHIHYGITGWLYFEKPESNIKFEFILKNIKTNSKINLYMEDKRRFSKIIIYDEKQHHQIISKLGIDIFGKDFTLNNFKTIINSKDSMIAPLLLKQEIFCGIVNYIKNEVMYMTKLKAKIKRFRQSGLEDGGEFSYENLTFKLLRRNGYIEKLINLKSKVVDNKLSITQ